SPFWPRGFPQIRFCRGQPPPLVPSSLALLSCLSRPPTPAAGSATRSLPRAQEARVPPPPPPGLSVASWDPPDPIPDTVYPPPRRQSRRVRPWGFSAVSDLFLHFLPCQSVPLLASPRNFRTS